jgi:hypothetical protein
MKTALDNREKWQELGITLAFAAGAATLLWFIGLAAVAAIPFWLVAVDRGRRTKGGGRAGNA